MFELISGFLNQLGEGINIGELDFLKKCFRAYSSKAHLTNVIADLETLSKMSPPPHRILDFGCGIGLQSLLLASLGYDVYGMETVDDKSLDGFLRGKAEAHKKTREESIRHVWEMIQKKADVQFQFYDGATVPFPDGHFDVVFAYAVLEHIPKTEVSHTIMEIKRILKGNGLFYIFQLPQRTSYTEFLAHLLGLEAHEYLWDFVRIKRLLKKAGFDIKFWQRADMLINHPYRIVNPLFPLLQPINRFLLHTPLSYFAHHLTVVAKKK